MGGGASRSEPTPLFIFPAVVLVFCFCFLFVCLFVCLFAFVVGSPCCWLLSFIVGCFCWWWWLLLFCCRWLLAFCCCCCLLLLSFYCCSCLLVVIISLLLLLFCVSLRWKLQSDDDVTQTVNSRSDRSVQQLSKIVFGPVLCWNCFMISSLPLPTWRPLSTSRALDVGFAACQENCQHSEQPLMACKPGFTGEPQITSVGGPLPPYPPSARIPFQLTITPIKVSQGGGWGGRR